MNLRRNNQIVRSLLKGEVSGARWIRMLKDGCRLAVAEELSKVCDYPLTISEQLAEELIHG